MVHRSRRIGISAIIRIVGGAQKRDGFLAEAPKLALWLCGRFLEAFRISDGSPAPILAEIIDRCWGMAKKTRHCIVRRGQSRKHPGSNFATQQSRGVFDPYTGCFFQQVCVSTENVPYALSQFSSFTLLILADSPCWRYFKLSAVCPLGPPCTTAQQHNDSPVTVRRRQSR